jgi:hypothetical protein
MFLVLVIVVHSTKESNIKTQFSSYIYIPFLGWKVKEKKVNLFFFTKTPFFSCLIN